MCSRDRVECDECRCHRSCGASLSLPRLVLVLLLAVLWVALLPGRSMAAPDFSRFEVGEGVAGVECITAGSNGTIESVVVPDDVLTNPAPLPKILAGDDGICDTTAAGDDVQVIPVGRGLADGNYILSGRDKNNVDEDNGICDNAVILLPGSDDNVLIPAGQSTPQQVGVVSGLNLILESGVGADDVASGIICPGSGDNFESSLANGQCSAPVVSAGNPCSTDADCDSAPAAGDGVCADDILELTSINCASCVSATNSCIIPGSNGILETTAGGNDFVLPVILTGADGVCDSAASGDDENLIPLGQGFQQAAFFPSSETTVCADTGSNGVAESTLCGNGAIDKLPSGADEECDDGNLLNGDGCDDDVASGGNCTFSTCGNGVVAPDEQCDDGNTNNNDNCTAVCTIATCGDAITCSAASCTTGPSGGPEQCDDANAVETDGCTSSCEALICGDGTIDPGELCDDGNQSNNDACLSNCTPASCGDAFKCTSAVCTTGPGGGPEGCDPPDGTTCSLQCGNIATPCPDGVINGLCSAPVAKDGNVCAVDADCDSSAGAGDGVCNVIETCDDGNSSNSDGCPTNCQIAVCGDGFVHESGGSEQCDDGNSSPGDGCDPACQIECGNGLIDGSCSQGLPFGTLCSANADCDTAPAAGDGRCAGEACDVGCGVATIDGACASGASGSCITNADCDTAPAAGDGLCLGSSCGAGCSAGLSGAAPNEPDCVAGNIGAGCSSNADCDSVPAAGDGLCRGPSCDTSGALDLFCGIGASVCSDLCQLAGCGNTLQECDEECDAGTANGVPGVGCDVDCTRTGIIGSTELTKARECVAAWSLDEAPDPVSKKKQTCLDCSAANKTGVCSAGVVGASCCRPSEALDCDSSPGAGDGRCSACDADAAVGVCTFKLAACLNRLGVPGCDSQQILSFELRGIRVTNPQQALAVTRITEAVRGLSPGKCTVGTVGVLCTQNQDCETSLGAADGLCSAVILGRCRKGAKRTTCTLGNDFECDRTFGGNNGKCDLGTGVRFLPWISQPDDGGDQQSTCTDSLDIQVAVGTRLKLKSLVRRLSGKSDRDGLKLVCK